jgi:hypothetical protein
LRICILLACILKLKLKWNEMKTVLCRTDVLTRQIASLHPSESPGRASTPAPLTLRQVGRMNKTIAA